MRPASSALMYSGRHVSCALADAFSTPGAARAQSWPRAISSAWRPRIAEARGPCADQVGALNAHYRSGEVEQVDRQEPVGDLRHSATSSLASDSARLMRPLRSVPSGAPEWAILLHALAVSAAQPPNLLLREP